MGFVLQSVQNDSLVSYVSTGSGRGKCRIKDFFEECDHSFTDEAATSGDSTNPFFVDFAGSDSLLKDIEYINYPDIQLYPAVAGPIVPIINIPGVPELFLHLETLARIFRGNITEWNDPAILDVNPRTEEELNEAGSIKVVVRDDKSGTTKVRHKSNKIIFKSKSIIFL